MPELIEKNELLLRKNVSTAIRPDGTVYELTHGVDGSMLVKSSKSGRTYRLGWRDVIDMAIAAGVNEDPTS